MTQYPYTEGKVIRMNQGGLGRKTNGMEPLWDFCILITFVCALGFPGNLEALLPGPVSTLVQYGPFMLQIVLMLMASSDTFMDIKLLDLKRRYVPVYLMLLTWTAVSMISTSFPVEQVISCVRLSVTALFALWILDHYDIHHILKLTYYAGLVLLFFTAVCVVLLPGRVYTYENGEKSFSGLFSTKNPCAAELSFELVIHALLFKDWRKNGKPLPKLYLVSLGLHLILLFICKGMSALFCAAIPIIYILIFEGRGIFKRRLNIGFLHTAVTIGFLILAMTVLPLLAPLFEAIGKDATLTGRTPMWNQLIHVMSNNNTFTGFGFTMFWKDPEAVKLFHDGFSRASWGNTMTFGAHNTLLEMWLDVGLLGIAAYFGMVMLSLCRPGALTEEQYDLCCSFMMWQTIKGLTERSFIPLHYQTLFLFFSVGIGCSRQLPKKGWHVPLRQTSGAPEQNMLK